MISPQLLMKCIVVPGLADLVDKRLKRHRDSLCSQNQWHRLREQALHGSVNDILEHLRHQKKRPKVKEFWNVPIEGHRGLATWLEEDVINHIMRCPDPMTLKRGLLHIQIILPERLYLDRFEEMKPIIVKRALCEFVDQVLLLLGEN
jgi:hypothetical protein